MALSAEIREPGATAARLVQGRTGGARRGGRRALIYAGESSVLVEAALAPAEIECVVARDPADALQRAARGRFALIVCVPDGMVREPEIAERLQALQPQADLIAVPVSELEAAIAEGLRLSRSSEEVDPWGSEAVEDWAEASDSVAEWSAMIGAWLGLPRERVNRLWLAVGLRDTITSERSVPAAEGELLELARLLEAGRDDRYDGTGSSPRRGREIPLEVRVVALAETISHALPSPMSGDPAALAAARREMLDEAGLRLDPQLVALAIEALA